MVRTANTFEETEEMQRWEGFNLSFLYVQLRIHFLQAVKIIISLKHQLVQKYHYVGFNQPIHDIQYYKQ